MDDFYKNIKDNLENRPEPPFNEQAWQDMEQRLNKKIWNLPRTFGWVWVLPLVLGSLLLSNIFFYKELNEANKKISHLELRTDTIHQKHVVYQYDTIYRSTIEKEYIVISEQPRTNLYTSQSTYFNQASTYSQRTNSINTSYAPLTFAELKFLFEKEQNEMISLLDENDHLVLGIPEKIDENQPGNLEASPYLTTQLATLSYESDDVDLDYLDPPADYMKARKRPLQKIARNLNPTGFQLGISGGLAFPQNEKISESRGYSFGIHGEMSFSKSLRLWLDATYYKVKFEIHEADRKLGVPILPPPTDDYIFSDAHVVDPFIQYSFGLQYLFNTHKKWKPYLGLGYSAASLLPYEIRYDFVHNTEDIDLSIQEEIGRHDFIMNIFLFSGGVEGELSKRVRFQLEGFYRWNGTNDGVVVPDILGVRSKFIYKF